MQYITTEKYLEKIHNIYSLVILAAKRTVGLTRGEKSLLPEVKDQKPGMIALEEIIAGKITLAPAVKDGADEKSAG
ncbi:MAG: DNA-directed RNA polymerase subunit omega [PVC group bacterium]